MTSTAVDRDLVRRARRIAIRSRRRVSDAMAGEFRSVFRGTGIEFESVRDYMFGDDVRAIDWNVTARFGRPFVKQFVESRERSLWLVVDRSASLAFGTAGDGEPRTKEDVALEVAAVLALSALRNRDRVGLLSFTDRVERILAPSTGPEWSVRLLHALLSTAPGNRGTDLACALGELRKRVRGRAVIFILSDFHNEVLPTDDLQILARRHDVVAVRVSDARELTLDGTGVVDCVDPETGERFLLDVGSARERRAFERAARKRNENVSRQLARAGVELVDVGTDSDPVVALLRFFARREVSRR